MIESQFSKMKRSLSPAVAGQFRYSLKNQRKNDKFHITKLDYQVRFGDLREVAVENVGQIMTSSFTSVVDDVRRRTAGGNVRMSVALKAESLPGGEVTLPFVPLDEKGFGGEQIGNEVERKMNSDKDFDPT